MSEEYRGEGLGYYYTRLQARREQAEKHREQNRTVNSAKFGEAQAVTYMV